MMPNVKKGIHPSKGHVAIFLCIEGTGYVEKVSGTKANQMQHVEFSSTVISLL